MYLIRNCVKWHVCNTLSPLRVDDTSAMLLSTSTDCFAMEAVLNSETACESFSSSGLPYFPFTQICTRICSGSHAHFWEEAPRTTGFGEFILTPSNGVLSLVIFLELVTHQQLMLCTNKNKLKSLLRSLYSTIPDREWALQIYVVTYFECWWLSKVLCMAIALLFEKKH